MKKNIYLSLFIFMTAILLSSCVTPPPKETDNICSIFHEYPRWYWDAKAVREHWGVPISVQMAIIYQESRFKATSKPPRKHVLWIIPWGRKSSSYGYTQAINQTWHRYQRHTGNNANRDDFAAAVDFIGWYANEAHRRTGIPLNNAYLLYLAYHEGVGGYLKGSYHHNASLKHVAWKVAHRAATYKKQLLCCERSIPKPHWWNIF